MALFYQNILRLEETILSLTSEHEFPKACSLALNQFDYHSFQGMSDLVNQMLQGPSCGQYYSPHGFGQVNLTLRKNKDFSILVAFMDDLSTEIHDHPFIGAFAPLLGNPLHISYTFSPTQLITPGITSGKLKVCSSKQLSIGTASEIDRKLIHCILRAQKNQFSLIVLKRQEDIKINNYYLFPHLKIESQTHSDSFYRFLHLFNTLSEQELPLEDWVNSLSALELLFLFNRLSLQNLGSELSQSNRLRLRRLANEKLLDFPMILKAIKTHHEHSLKLTQFLV